MKEYKKEYKNAEGNEGPILIKTCPSCRWSLIEQLDIFELPNSICENCGGELEVERGKGIEIEIEFKLFKEAHESIKYRVAPQQRKCVLGTVIDQRIEIYLDNIMALTKEDTGALIFMLERITLHELAHAISPTKGEDEIHRFTDKAMIMRLLSKKSEEK
jgi:transcription initiation factor TFIIIB Brf1 subunit/transcription initiation factor TFIIB